ncbi:MAG: GyrI-like domain-containing protein [Rhizobiales bacterium]|nr:GyrI-like domain-containing protein [Hyphomicrobiales bacterium]
MPCTRLAVSIFVALACTAGPAVAQPAIPPAQSQPALPASPSPLQPGDVFGEPVEMAPRTIIFMTGHTNWDAAFDTLVDTFKSLNEYLVKHGIKPNGPAMTIYTETDDTGFQFKAAMPIAAAPTVLPKGDIAVGQAPSGKALKFVHRGSYDAMDSTYEAITNYLEEKGLDAKELFIEEYASDPVKSDPNKLVVNVFVPVK